MFRFLTFVLFLFTGYSLLAQGYNPYSELLKIAPHGTLYQYGQWLPLQEKGVDILAHSDTLNRLNRKEHYDWEHVTLVNSCLPSVRPDYGTHDSLFNRYRFDIWGYNPDTASLEYLVNHPASRDATISFTDWDYSIVDPNSLNGGFVFFDKSDNLFHLRTDNYMRYDTTVLDSSLFWGTFPRLDYTYDLDSSLVSADSTTSYNHAFNTTRYYAVGLSSQLIYADVLTKQVTYFLPSELWFSNSSRSTFFIDFDDGNGPVPLQADYEYDIQYSTSGERKIRIYERDDCDPTEELCVVTAMAIDVSFIHKSDSQFAVSSNTVVHGCELNYSLSTELRDFGGGLDVGSAVISVWLRDSNPDPNGRITKPVIVLDGFNSVEAKSPTDDLVNFEGRLLTFGKINATSIASGRFKRGDGTIGESRALSRFPNFIDSVNANDYDFVLVDWQTNRTSIQANANALKKILLLINEQMSDAGSGEQTVVVGPSMGGQIARVALREMELENCCHNTRLYVSFDSPHQGANIPLGLQELLYSLTGYFDTGLSSSDKQVEDATKQYEWVLASPAARQMLLQHRSGNAPSIEYYAYLDSIGYPENVECIAVTNGSFTGMQQGERSYTPNNNLEVSDAINYLNPGEPYLDLEANMRAPIAIPGFIEYFIGVGISWFGDTTVFKPHKDFNWSIVRASPYAMSQNTSGTLNQLVLARGKSGVTNKDEYIAYLIGGVSAETVFWIIMSGPPPAAQAFGLNYGIIATTSFSSLVNQNRSSNPSSQYGVYYSGPGYAMDHVPGSFITTPYDFASVDDRIFTLYEPNHTFMPTTSTIGLDLDSFNVDVSSLHDTIIAKIPFSSVYFNRTSTTEGAIISHNQEHVEITDQSIAWIMNHIRVSEGYPDTALTAQGDWKISNGQVYNFADPVLSISATPPATVALSYLPDILIENGGELAINFFSQVGYYDLNGPIARSGVKELHAERHHCSGGASYVVVESLGRFFVGDTTSNQFIGRGIFPEGSTLEVKGSLIVSNSSQLVIEEGATLIIHPGAKIVLRDAQSELRIEGKLILKPNASFEVTGDGFVAFAIDGMTWANSSNSIVLEGDNTFKIEHNNSTNPQLVIEKKLFLTQDWDSVVVNSARVDIWPNAYLDVRAKYSINHSTFDIPNAYYGTSQLHNGLRIYGFNSGEVLNSTFMHGKFGLFANANVGSNSSIAVQNCTFRACTEGVSTRGGSIELSNCIAKENEIGFQLKDYSSSSEVNNCLVDSNSIGIKANSTGSTALQIHATSTSYNNVGTFVTDVLLQPSCSEWIGNGSGIKSISSEIDLSNYALCAFEYNDTSIRLTNHQELYLVDGYNTFDHFKKDLYGDFYYSSGTGNLTGPVSSNYRLDMDENYPASTMVYSLSANIYSTNWNVQLINTSPSMVYASCEAVVGPVEVGKRDVGEAKSILRGLAATGIHTVQTTSVFGKNQLPENIIAAMVNRDSLNVKLTSDSIVQVLTAMNLVTQQDSNLYFSALRRVTSALMALKVEVSDSTFNFVTRQWRNCLDSSSSTRMTDALIVLSTVARYSANYEQAIYYNSWAQSFTQDALLAQHLLKWDCILQNERAFVYGEITNDQYITRGDSCQLSFTMNKNSRYVHPASTPMNTDEILFYPNPSDGIAVLHLPENSGVLLRIVDVNGRIIQSRNMDKGAMIVNLDERGLLPGLYFVQIISNSNQLLHQIKWVIQQ